MRLRIKICISILLLAILVFAAIQGIMYFVLEPTFIDNDKQTCLQQTSRAVNILNYRISVLTNTVKPYATMDDTYQFIQNQNSNYIDKYYNNSAFDRLHLNLIAIVNNKSELIYYQSYDLLNSEKVDASPDILSNLASKSLWQSQSPNEMNRGLLVIDHQPMIVSIIPILSSQAHAPVGWMLFGTYLDETEINTLTELTGIKFTLTEPSSLNDAKTLYALVSGEASTVVKVIDAHSESGYTLLRDIYGETGFVVQVTTERSSYQTSLYLRNIMLILAVGTSAMFAAVMFILLDRDIIKPLTKMAGYVEEISLNPNFSPPQVKSTEEFEVLTDAVQNTLKRKLEGMNEVAVMVAHDLRNPLAGIRNSTYLLKKRYGSKLDAEGLAILDRIENSVRYTDSIVQNLVEYSSEIKLNKVERTPKQLIDKTLQKMYIPGNIQVINQTSDSDTVMVDAAKIERVFTNLVGNAFDAMPDGGTLRIVNRRTRGGYVAIDFVDSGMGLSEKALMNVWKPFFTTKPKGMGIGLSICQRIVDAHGGKIEVKSQVGKGACFTVVLPSG